MSSISDTYSLVIDRRDDCVYALIDSKENSGQIIVDAFACILAECRAIKVSKVFVEHKTPKPLSTSEAYDAAVGVVDLNFAGIRIAYLDRDATHLETNQFGELVAVNRGVIGKAFSDQAEAEAWLTNE